MRYEIRDSHGAPQCGCEITSFDDWGELEDYLDENPVVLERIEQQYAVIVESED